MAAWDCSGQLRVVHVAVIVAVSAGCIRIQFGQLHRACACLAVDQRYDIKRPAGG